METLNVDLDKRSYPIYIGNGLLDDPCLLQNVLANKRCATISNPNVARLYWHKLKPALAEHQQTLITLPDGEQYKTLDSLNTIFTELLNQHFDRDSVLIALGGGVIGDMTGFAAACYQRGIHFIQIPTTLLAQVDSSVGGKTAVNHSLGKNMIGAFHQPIAVIADTNTLQTLADNERIAGIAEIIKYGLISDQAFFDWLENNIGLLLDNDPASCAYAIKKSCQIKADIVARDETEQSVRALLNLGHTFGHAIETYTAYTRFLHGECVGIGMVLAAKFSAYSGYISQSTCWRICQLIKQAKLPVDIPENIDNQTFIELMLRDKKTLNQQIRLILLKNIGDAFITAKHQANELQTFLDIHNNESCT